MIKYHENVEWHSPRSPPDPTAFEVASKHLLLSTMVVLASPLLLGSFIYSHENVYSILAKSSKKSIRYSAENGNKVLKVEVWKTRIGKLYANAVEYQKTEGYCSVATKRSILKSIPAMEAIDHPEGSRGGVTIDKFAIGIDEESKGITKSTVILGSEMNFDKFLEIMKSVNDPTKRIVANFLRSSLFGYQTPWILPSNFLLSVFGGHYSPIVGYWEDTKIVAIFDVNHNFGLFFVSAERLYDAVTTFDIQSGASRGLVVIEVVQQLS